MKKAFTLFELIIVVIIISIIASYLLINSKDSITFVQKTSIKSDIALIRSAIQREKSSNILLNKNESFSLDSSVSNKENEELFTNVLKTPLISTNEYKKEFGKWIKLSTNSYKVYLDSNISLVFEFKDGAFNCKSDLNLCKEYE